ncbi:MAG: hypothetical protein PSX71_15125 [bacterium]|nr:hypothetical protein [bacterium]
MNMSGQQIASNSPAKAVEHGVKPESGKTPAVPRKMEHAPNGAANDAAKNQAAPVLSKTINALPHPIWENHQTRSRQQRTLPSMDELKARWKNKIGIARTVWSKLSEKELLESDGHKLPLVCLIQERHDITRDEANKQVNHFFEQHMT